jgi:pimeloyl-ACP methyl ester carboxylesterase
LPYDAVEVVFPNEEEGFALSGTLTLPRTEAPVPAVVLISGSGAQNRDEEAYNHRPFLVLADHLTRQGIAVLRYDDRGVGGSGGERATATPEDFAGDAWAAVQFLLTETDRIDPSWIGLVGHSEGGLVAPLVASDHGEVAFVVLLAGPGLPGDELNVLQQEAMLRAYGVDEDQIAAISEGSRKIYRTILEGQDRAASEARIREISESFGKDEATIDAELPIYFSEWYRFFLSYDPAPALARLACPVLSLRGTVDLQVTVENHEAIRRALAGGASSDYAVIELEGLNHLFQTATLGLIEEYVQIEETFAPRALDTISEWILRITGR